MLSLRNLRTVALVSLVVAAVSSLPGRASRLVDSASAYPYGGPEFTSFIRESYSVCGMKSPEDFYHWMNRKYLASHAVYPGKQRQTIERVLDSRGREIRRLSTSKARAQAIVSTSAWLHKMIKATIVKFSFDRGFEFANVVKYDERQCLLQSVLLSGMLQKMGVRAGAAMVYENHLGQRSNMGHVVSVVKLPTNQDLMVDCSEKLPFARHKGLLMNAGGYRFMEPHFLLDSPRISSYTLTGSRKTMKPSQIQVLDPAYLRSQFFYYRGERTKGGILATGKAKTQPGLRQSAVFLRRSVALNPSNPLAVYMLGRTLGELGQQSEADRYLLASVKAYRRAGWLPPSPKAFAEAAAKRRSG